MEYDFELEHIASKRNGQADALSRRPDHNTGNEDNKGLVVLPERFFAKEPVKARVAGSDWANPNDPQEWQVFVADENNEEPWQSIHDHVMTDQSTPKSQAQIKKWSKTHQIIKQWRHWWKGTWPVVASDNNLKRGVIHLFHDKPSTGHPGISNTYTKAKEDFW